MFFGGRLYPDVLSMGLDAADVAFVKAGFACAERGIDAHHATNTPTRRQFKAFRTGITSLRFNSPAKSERQNETL
jgi:hypothetical protein